MHITEADKETLRNLCVDPQSKQRLHMLIYQAIADATDLPGRDIEQVFQHLDNLLELPEATKSRRDPAL